MSCSLGVLARTVFVLPDAAGCAACNRYFPCKASADVLDYYIDLSPWLLQQNDAILTASDATVTTLQKDDYDLKIESQQIISASQIQIFLASGHSGATEGIQISVTTAQGRTLLVSASIYIDSCSASVAAPAASSASQSG